MKAFVALACFVAAAHGIETHKLLDRNLDAHWSAFKKAHDKKYTLLGEEFNRRLNFEKNVKKINQHNLEADLGLHTYRLGLNKYADLSAEEFATKLMGFKAGQKPNATEGVFRRSDAALPDSVDWRQKGYVTPVKDQGQCGSCWSFSSTGSMEGQNFAKTGKLISLSEQQLVDCSTPEGNAGCGGGWMDQAFQSVIRMKGIMTEEDYAYHAVQGSCAFKDNAVAARLQGYQDIDKSEEALQEAVATVGPISVALDATNFGLYKSGVFYDQTCQVNSPDHAVLVVGYGTDRGQDYWLVKNSWGTTWGEDGYIRMLRNFHNMCGIANYATYPKMA